MVTFFCQTYFFILEISTLTETNVDSRKMAEINASGRGKQTLLME